MKTFAETERIDVTRHIEKKGQFSYISWVFAVSEFRKAYPDGYWRIKDDGALPYSKDESGAYVAVTVYLHKECPGFTQIHPVLNHKNKPIATPNSFDINTSIQRCLVKAIAIATGIGLHIYAGEDLPPADTTPVDIDPLLFAISGAMDLDTLILIWKQDVSAVWTRIDAHEQTRLTQAKDERKTELEAAV